MARQIELTTPLGTDVLLFRAMHGREELGRISEFDLSALSTRADISPGDLLAKNVTVKLELWSGGYRYYNGYVTRFAQGGTIGRYYQYRMTVRPWLWFLTRTTDCRIFQEKTVPDIIKEVFADHPVAVFEDGLTGTYAKREYCVQYRETDFDFVSRLMEEEGIYYYLEHADGRHVLKLVDSYSGHKALENISTIPYYPPHKATNPAEEYIQAWTFAQSIQPGAVTLDDYDFTKPKADLTVKAKLVEQHERADYEVFDYPGEYWETDDGDHYARARVDELHAGFDRAEGECNVREIAVGRLFNLTNAPRQDQEREYLITGAWYELRDNAYETAAEEGATTYHCQLTVLQSRQQFRPDRITPRPTVRGPQTAVVVGPAGEEIWTDKYGRVKVQFHWDRYGKKNENSSCWIRVAQAWAGKRWGAHFWPRIGQEVIVGFLEGDPDKPIIIGSVYNADQMPAYQGDGQDPKHSHDNKVSGVKSNTTPGGVGFNEFRFDDSAGKQQVFIHAERNMDTQVKNDCMEQIGASRHLGVGGDQNEQVGGNKNLTVKKDHVEKIEGNMLLLVGGTGGNQDIVIKATKKELIEADSHLHVNGKRNEQVDGSTSLTVGGDQQESVTGKHALDVKEEIHLKAGQKIVIEAAMEITFVQGGNFIKLDPSGVTIFGAPMTLINSGGAPGVGSGSLPEPPLEAQPATPAEPAAADDSRSGSRSGPA